MKLSQLAAKPQLIEISIDDADTITEHGEPLIFYTWDRQPLPMFMKLASITGSDSSGLVDIVRTLILDEHGKEIINNDSMLPTPVLLRCIAKITDMLGK